MGFGLTCFCAVAAVSSHRILALRSLSSASSRAWGRVRGRVRVRVRGRGRGRGRGRVGARVRRPSGSP